MYPAIGITELINIFLIVALLLAFPLSVIILLVRIHEKLKNIEGRLKDK